MPLPFVRGFTSVIDITAQGFYLLTAIVRHASLVGGLSSRAGCYDTNHWCGIHTADGMLGPPAFLVVPEIPQIDGESNLVTDHWEPM